MKKLHIILAALGFPLVAVIAITIMLWPSSESESQQPEDNTPIEVVENEDNIEEVPEEIAEPELPVEQPEWAIPTWQWSQNDENFRGEIIEWANESQLFDELQLSESVLEDVMFAIVVNAQLMIDPLFGRWHTWHQELPEEDTFLFLEEVTNEPFTSENIPVISLMNHPELTEAGFDPTFGFSYMGEIQSIEFEGLTDDYFENGVLITLNIRYSSQVAEDVFGTLSFVYTIDDNVFNAIFSDFELSIQ